MRQIVLGATGLRVSRLGFGGIPIQRLDEAEAVAVVRGCLDLGITFVDTANGYSTSEERIGKAIAGRRDGLVIASKTHAKDRETARANLELSLRRLATDWIDVYQLHGVSSDEGFAAVTAPGGAYEALLEAREQGLIRHIGASSHSLQVAKKLVTSGLFETIQYPLNLIADEAERELLPLTRGHGVGFIAMKPIGGGLIPNARLAVRYLAQFEDVVPDPGIQAVSEMEELISALPDGTEALSDADRAEIELIRAELGTRFCHRCDYCQPCTEDIAISTVLSIGSNMRRFPLDRVFGEQMVATVRKALECSDCGLCEQRCPYGLAIRETLSERASFYLREKDRYGASLRT